MKKNQRIILGRRGPRGQAAPFFARAVDGLLRSGTLRQCYRATLPSGIWTVRGPFEILRPGSSHCSGHADSRIDRRHGRDAGSEAQCGGSASASRTISANNKVTRVVTPVGDSLPDFHAPPAVPRSTFCSRGRELKQGIGRAAGETLSDSAQMFPMLTTGADPGPCSSGPDLGGLPASITCRGHPFV